MIQNIEPHVYRNEYVPEPPKEDSVILYYEGRKILVKLEDQEISFLTFKEAAVCYPRISCSTAVSTITSGGTSFPRSITSKL